MSSLPILRRRIRSVGNTRQITKAMQLVAASKLRQAEAAAHAPAPYAGVIQQLASQMAAWPEAQQHPLLARREARKVLLILVTSDRGLAGAYNSSVLREMSRQLQGEATYFAICVGRRGASAVARASDVTEIAAYDMEGDEADIELAKPIAREAADGFENGQFDQVRLIFTRFHSTVRQEVAVQQLLPVPNPAASLVNGLTDPDVDQVVRQTMCRYLEAMVMQALAESQASEQAARMLAMMNATENAGNLIDDLTLAYNQERQAAITQELAEISAGVEALQGESV